jgi:hypothetical protein
MVFVFLACGFLKGFHSPVAVMSSSVAGITFHGLSALYTCRRLRLCPNYLNMLMSGCHGG